MKPRLIDSSYDAETRTAWAKIDTNLGEFEGFATCHEDDEPSKYLGCQMAEYRAARRYMRKEKMILKSQIKALRDAYTMVEQCKGFNEQSVEARKMRKAIYMKVEILEALSKNIESLSTAIDNLPAERQLVKDKLIKKKQ